MSESRGCPSCKTSKGEAVVGYREPLATQQMGYHRLSRRVNKMENIFSNYISLMEEISIVTSLYEIENIIICI